MSAGSSTVEAIGTIDTGLLGFVCLGVIAVVAFVYQVGSMIAAIVNPPVEEAAAKAPAPVAAVKKVVAKLPRVSSRERRCGQMSTALMQETDVEAGVVTMKPKRSSSKQSLAAAADDCSAVTPLNAAEECTSP